MRPEARFRAVYARFCPRLRHILAWKTACHDINVSEFRPRALDKAHIGVQIDAGEALAEHLTPPHVFLDQPLEAVSGPLEAQREATDTREQLAYAQRARGCRRNLAHSGESLPFPPKLA